MKSVKGARKWCFVPGCSSSSAKTPEKRFVNVPAAVEDVCHVASACFSSVVTTEVKYITHESWLIVDMRMVVYIQIHLPCP